MAILLEAVTGNHVHETRCRPYTKSLELVPDYAVVVRVSITSSTRALVSHYVQHTSWMVSFVIANIRLYTHLSLVLTDTAQLTFIILLTVPRA